MKMSSPERLQTIRAPVAARIGRARPRRRMLERWTTSGSNSSRRRQASFSTSLRWCPASPSSAETVIAPRSSGLVCAVRPESQVSRRRPSRSRSRNQGVWRKKGTNSCSQMFTPPITTRCSATSSSSVVVGTYAGRRIASRPRCRSARTSALSWRHDPQILPPAPAVMWTMRISGVSGMGVRPMGVRPGRLCLSAGHAPGGGRGRGRGRRG